MDEYVSGGRYKRDMGKHFERDVVCFGGSKGILGCYVWGRGRKTVTYPFSKWISIFKTDINIPGMYNRG